MLSSVSWSEKWQAGHLKRESAHNYFVGKNVAWKATISSVSDASHGTIVVYLVHNGDS